MKNKNKLDEDILIKIIKGQADPENLKIFNGWLENSDSNATEFESLKLLWEKTGTYKTVSIPDSDVMWTRILEKINNNDKKLSRTIDFSFIMKIAAVILVAVSILILYNHLKENSLPQNNVKELSYSGASKIVDYKLVAQSGEKITCVLPDSSVVHLNSESRLEYPENFAGNIRIVELTGEAFFSVKHDKNRPFIVKAGNSQVTVTGTQFNVRNRDNNTKVVVAKGTVNVLNLNSRKQENLKKGEMVQLDYSGNVTSPVTVNLKYYLAWKENKLAFKHTPLKEVMAEIERTFNVKSEFRNQSYKYRTITGIFETDSLEKVLSVLSLTLDLNISQKGMKIIIQ
jgi:transmembrane sensor